MTSFEVDLDHLLQLNVEILRLGGELEDGHLIAAVPRAAGAKRVTEACDDFVHGWADGRAKVARNIGGLGTAVLGVVGAYRDTEGAICEAAAPQAESNA